MFLPFFMKKDYSDHVKEMEAYKGKDWAVLKAEFKEEFVDM